MVRLLFIGDIIGRPGRRAARSLVERMIGEHRIDLVIANGENAAGGFGLTADATEELFGSCIDILTSGNHIWDKKDVLPLFKRGLPILRPANYPPGLPGKGWGVFETPGGVPVGIVNLEGRVFMNNLECPFRTADRILDELSLKTKVIFVDFHAEATSEKLALGRYLDGRVSALIGTHTHVQTADDQILPGGTAYLTDVGMTGGHGGIIGMGAAGVLERFMTQTSTRFEVEKGDVRLHGVLLDIDEETGRGLSIKRIAQSVA